MDHKTENQLSYGWMKGFSTVQLENFAESQKKYKTPGVGVHPGNIGMKHIAECYYAIINAILSTKCNS